MLAVAVNSTGVVSQGATTVASTNITGVAAFIWCATARDRTAGVSGSPNANSVRESDLVFMRGLKERITIATDSDMSWRWRRICFTKKGPNGLTNPIYALSTTEE